MIVGLLVVWSELSRRLIVVALDEVMVAELVVVDESRGTSGC